MCTEMQKSIESYVASLLAEGKPSHEATIFSVISACSGQPAGANNEPACAVKGQTGVQERSSCL
jgi:hypothetical protein